MTVKEIDALEAAISKAQDEAYKYRDIKDNGPSNFDAPAVRLKATARQLAGMDWAVYKWHRRGRSEGGGVWFIIDIDLEGQGYRRTRMAQAAVESLKASGYDAMLYRQLD